MAPEVNSTSVRAHCPEEQSDDSGLAREMDRPLIAEPEPEPEPTSVELLTLEGNLQTTLSGGWRTLQLITGLSLLRWLGLGILQLIGYAHPARLKVRQGQIVVEGKRRLLGLDLGATRQAIPLTQLMRVAVVGRSFVWTVAAALAALIITAAAGSVLVLWGIAGRQVSWALLGLLVIGCGVLVDALAYLLVRRNRRMGLADLELHTRRIRLRLARVPEREAARLVEHLES